MTKPLGTDTENGMGKPDAFDVIKRVVKRTPVVRDLARMAMKWRAARNGDDFSSADYWESRYREGRNSGAGSYNRLAEFKADIINRFVAEHDVTSVIEFGCGDGSQLRLAKYPSYVGVDVSPTVIESIQRDFKDDTSKVFIHLDEVSKEHCSDLAMSLDVIYHLVEDEVFESHMRQLFSAARQYVIVYASNDERVSDSIHVRHRRFTDWVERNRPDFRQVGFVKNAYPESVNDIDNTSFADFYFFGKAPDVSQM
jgi:SAM-dependent methyltransferase